MIQGGDPNTKTDNTSSYGTGGPGYKFADEPNDLPMARGMLAVANSGPNTNGSQFFITVAPTPSLEGSYNVFGKVISGQDVANKISKVSTNPEDKPITPVIIESITINK